jgi:hypothetical protein
MAVGAQAVQGLRNDGGRLSDITSIRARLLRRIRKLEADLNGGVSAAGTRSIDTGDCRRGKMT